MSLDRLLMDVDLALVGIAENVQRLLTVATIFLPVFIVAFALLVVMLIGLLVVSIYLQFKRLRAAERRRPSSSPTTDNQCERHALSPADLGEKKSSPSPPVSASCYRRVASDPRLFAPAHSPTIVEPGPERRFPMPFPAEGAAHAHQKKSQPAEAEAASFGISRKPVPIPITILAGTREERKVWLMGRQPQTEEHQTDREGRSRPGQDEEGDI